MQICQFIANSSGLEVLEGESEGLCIFQKTDGKRLTLNMALIEDVIARLDSEGHDFLQINFLDGRKILLTERLVGFKPAPNQGLDMSKLPKVVTTPDLVSVVEAIEESLNSEDTHPVELEVLRKVFEAVIDGGEAVGFNLESERAWVKRLAAVRRKASA